MSLLDQAKADIQTITANSSEFGRSITFTAPDDSTATVIGLHSKHHLAINPDDGTPVNAKNAHISVSEALLTAASYPVRNASGEVNLKGHVVSVKDSTGLSKNYKIREWFPDETIGLITCILDSLDG